MKIQLWLLVVLVSLAFNLSAQDTTGNFYTQIKKYDLSKVLLPDSITDMEDTYLHPEPLGFIDTSYQRFQIHISSIVKDKQNPYMYVISGKTKVGNEICEFEGVILITSANINKNVDFERDFPNYRFGGLTGLIKINQDRKCVDAGFIRGLLSLDFVIDDKGAIMYDAMMMVADGYSNNQVIGEWTDYSNTIKKICNWGDFRIPDCGDLDWGAGYFFPNEKYYDKGWKNYADYELDKESDEEVEWWKE